MTTQHRVKADINRGATITLFGNVFKLSEFFLTLLAARLFGVQVWGQYIFLNAFFMPVLRLASAGMDKGLVWFLSRNQERRIPAAFFRKVQSRTFLFATILLLGVAAYQLLLPHKGKIETNLIEPVSLLFMGLAVPFMVLTNLNIGVSIAFKKVEHDVLVRGIVYPFTQLGLPCLLAFWSTQTRVLAGSLLFGCIVGFVISARLAAPLKKRLAEIADKETAAAETEGVNAYFRTLWQYSWPMGLREVVLSFQQRIDIWCLALFLSPDSIGVYGLALSIANSVKTVRQSFDSILLAVISRLKRSVDSLEIKNAFLHAGELIIALQMPIFAFLVFFAPNLLQLSGEAYAQGEPVLVIFALALILNSYLGLSGMVVMGLGKSRWALINDLLGLALVVVLNLILVPHYGIVGAALATTASLLTISFIWYCEAVYLIKKIPLNVSVVLNFLGGVCLVSLIYYLWKRHGDPGLMSRSIAFGAFAVIYGVLLLIKFRKSIPLFGGTKSGEPASVREAKEYADLKALAEAEMGSFDRIYITPHLNEGTLNPYLVRLYAPFSAPASLPASPSSSESPSANPSGRETSSGLLHPLTSFQFLRPWARRLFLRERAIWHQHWLQFSSLPTFIRTNFRLLASALYVWSGGRILWTIHNERPHVEKYVALNMAYMRLLSRLAFRIHVHNHKAVPVVADLFGVPASRVTVLAHPHFDTHPIPREEARKGLLARYGVETEGKKVFLMFGIIAEYKGIAEVMDIFSGLDPAKALLIVAGPPRGNEAAYAAALREKGKTRSIVLLDRMIPEEDVNLFFCGADWAIFNHRRSLNSSAMQLASDYGCRIIAPDLEAASILKTEGLFKFATREELAGYLRAQVDALL